jgi:dihydrofolate reductase
VSRGIIAAVSPEGVIGVDGTIPWHYPSDMKRFKRLTEGTTVVMGRLTWESLPRKPLVNRRNVVITSRHLEGVECYASIAKALESCEGDVWFIGGARVYEEAMDYADVIDLTYVPDTVESEGAVYFPEIDETLWEPGPVLPAEDDPLLKRQRFTRRKP